MVLCDTHRHDSKYRKMLESDDWDALAAEFGSRVGGEIDPERFGASCMRFERPGHHQWGDGEWSCWLMNRAFETSVCTLSVPDDNGRLFTCDMHVGFLYIHEPQWMLEFLRTSDERVIPENWSRHCIWKETTPLQPINRVAARVASALARID